MCTLRFVRSCLFKKRPFNTLTTTYPLMVNRLASSRSFPIPSLYAEDDEEMDDQEQCDSIGNKYMGDPSYPILGNRNSDLFYMPLNVGPAYQCLMTTADHFYQVDNYDNTDEASNNERNDQLEEIEVSPCPKLLSSCIKDLFVHPYGEFNNSDTYTILNLHFNSDVNSAIKAFVLKASQYSLALLYKGYWADFVNPFTGRAYFRSGHRNLMRDARFFGHNMIIKDVNGCIIIEETNQFKFTGAIVTDAPLSYIKTLWQQQQNGKMD